MFTYLFKISYDGSKYYGWSKQNSKKLKTIQGLIEKKLSFIFHQEICILGASRTDKGVHAHGQLFILKSSINLNLIKFKKTFNKIFQLDSIYCLSIFKFKKQVNVFKNIYQKQYIYLINTNKTFNLFEKNYVFQYNKPIDKNKFQSIINIFQGQHNFFNFSGLKESENINSVRKIDQFIISKNKGILSIKIRAKSFIRYQIRKMIMATLFCYNQKIDKLTLINWLKTSDQSNRFNFKISACGLYLDWIRYRKKL
jgi:tRNA pseudouridine38-40 synthase